MSTGVLCLLTLLAAVPEGTAARVTEQAFLDATAKDGRVRAILDEPLALARAERARAGVLANPEASFERESPDGEPRVDSWSVSWVPPLDLRPFARASAARAGVTAASQRRELAAVGQRAEAREAFADWTIALEGAELGERLAALVDRLARRAEAQSARGEASALSARRLLLARVEVHAEAARLAAERAHAGARVRAWLPDLPREARPERPPLPPVPADTGLAAGSPLVAALAADVRQAELLRGVAERFWALPELSVGQQRLRFGTTSTEGPTVGVRWPLPLFDRGQGDRIESRARLDAARAREQLELARLREGVAAAIAAYARLREAAALAADADDAGARVLTSAAAVFEAGESDVTDLLETLRGVLAGQLAALDARRAALRAHRDLEQVAGRALPLTEGDGR